MLIDLHTHTFPRSDDSFLRPEELFQQAKAAGLDGVCLTEHDTFWDEEALQRWSREWGLLILPGCEVNTEEGHLLVFGLSRYVFGMHRAAFVRSMVDRVGGAVVLAHLYRRVFNPQAHRDHAAYAKVVANTASSPVFSLVDAVEVVNGRGSHAENGFSLDVARLLGKPPVASSDAHKLSDVGTCVTRFSRPIQNVRDLIAEIKAGRCEPVALRLPHPDPRLAISPEAR